VGVIGIVGVTGGLFVVGGLGSPLGAPAPAVTVGAPAPAVLVLGGFVGVVFVGPEFIPVVVAPLPAALGVVAAGVLGAPDAPVADIGSEDESPLQPIAANGIAQAIETSRRRVDMPTSSVCRNRPPERKLIQGVTGSHVHMWAQFLFAAISVMTAFGNVCAGSEKNR
jgi:hypothetical protein